MPPRIESDDDDERNEHPLRSVDGNVSDDDSHAEASYQDSPHGRKRARLGEDGRASRREPIVKNEPGSKKHGSRSTSARENREQDASFGEDAEVDGGELSDEAAAAPRPKVKTQPRDIDGYVPGSIVRMKLVNFLTYDHAEFRPGPYLNMVLGPNGTGKSSIACAICLGLGFSTKLLGRAHELNQFVKIGASEGSIEIELKGAAGKKNVVIERKFTHVDKTSIFKVNGKPSTQKEVATRVRELNVQVDNLCSFLPQDRVQEFAGLTPIQLLRATQQAAGEAQLVKWHDILIDGSKQKKTAVETLEVNKAKLDHERGLNEQLKPEVEKYKQRQAIKAELDFWNAALPFVEYNEAWAKHQVISKEHQIIKAQVAERMGRNQPLHDRNNDLKNKVKITDEARNKTADELKRAKVKLQKTFDAPYKGAEHETDKAVRTLEQVDKDEKKRLDEIAKLNREIAELERKIANPPPMPEPQEDVDRDIKEVRGREEGVAEEKDALTQRMTVVIRDERNARTALETESRKLASLEDATRNRINALGRWDDSVAQVALWLQQNQHHFQQPVFLPPCVSVSVPDKKYQRAVEACLNAAQMKTFVPQTSEDYDLFNSLVNDGKGLKNPATDKPYRVNVWFRGNMNLPALPFGREELPKFGFDCYALDKVECPDGLRYFLQAEAQLHRTPIGLRESSINTKAVIERISAVAPYRGSFIGDGTRFTVQRSSYGAKLPFMNSNAIRNAQSFANTSASPEEKRNAETRVQQARQTLSDIQANVEELRTASQQLDLRANEIRQQMDAVRDRQNKIKNVKQWTSKNKLELDKRQTALNERMNAESPDAERGKAKKDILKSLQRRANILLEYKNAVHAVMAAQEKHTTATLSHMQAKVNQEYVQNVLNTQDHQTKIAHEKLVIKKQEFLASKKHIQELKAKADQAIHELPAELHERFAAVPQEEREAWSINSINEQIDHLTNELDSTIIQNTHVIEQYERRQKEIETLETKHESFEARVKSVDERNDKTKKKWYPALKSLVTGIGERFSAAFDRMGCAGEVRVTETDDYATWTLDILVKFRSTEKLQQLTDTRQSGGERSLSTILYLMSLTEYARAPFSLVDEINQGMDNRAERAVHDQLVQVTCSGDAGQYFLITPKLLADLTYHKRMRILCINNGDWLPEEPIGNLRAVVEKYAVRRGP